MNAATNDANRPADQRRGLNFWQWLGIAIIVIGVLFYLYRNLGPGEPQREEPPVQPDTNDTAPVQAEGASNQPADGQ